MSLKKSFFIPQLGRYLENSSFFGEQMLCMTLENSRFRLSPKLSFRVWFYDIASMEGKTVCKISAVSCELMSLSLNCFLVHWKQNSYLHGWKIQVSLRYILLQIYINDLLKREKVKKQWVVCLLGNIKYELTMHSNL